MTPEIDLEDYKFVNMESPRTLLTLTKVSKIKKLYRHSHIFFLGRLSIPLRVFLFHLKKTHGINVLCFRKKDQLRQHLDSLVESGGWKSCTVIQHKNSS